MHGIFFKFECIAYPHERFRSLATMFTSSCELSGKELDFCY